MYCHIITSCYWWHRAGLSISLWDYSSQKTLGSGLKMSSTEAHFCPKNLFLFSRALGLGCSGRRRYSNSILFTPSPPPPLTLPLSLYSGYLLRLPCGLEGFPEGIPQTIIFPPPHRVCCNFPESLVFPGLLYQVEKSSPEDLVMQKVWITDRFGTPQRDWLAHQWTIGDMTSQYD